MNFSGLRAKLRFDPLPYSVLLIFIALNTLLRIGLWLFNTERDFTVWQVAKFLAVGLAYDFTLGLVVAIPALVVAWCWPAGRWSGRAYRVWSAVWWTIACTAFLFVALSEVVFWNEFGARFNFIAVDYLIYTREVIGNIRESYPLGKIFGGLGVVTLVLAFFSWRWLQPAQGRAATFKARTAPALVWLVLAVAATMVIDARWKDMDDDARVGQLAGNGVFEFLHAFRNNEIDYAQFYHTIPMARAIEVLRGEFEQVSERAFVAKAPLAIEREVVASGPPKKLNVVLITVESLSASFMGTFGNAQHLTPYLDQLAKQSLLFTNLYATGTRTVRGLEALTLSLPPTPGNSVVKRPDNDNLFTLGEVFAEQGYEPLYIYGGYGYFDNMNAFFGGNGYTVIDRTALKKEDISYENIWGVADEDLFKLTLRELDQRQAQGKHFFAHLMTTSNHRPFGFPANRIDLPQGQREGAVKYTDWAIGQFIEAAKKHAWFNDTVFVVVADHCAEGRGKVDLPIQHFHIPLMIYAPGHIRPRQVDTLASQIDFAPTLLSLLNFSYTSRFFGQDILTDGVKHQRALMANYQTVGYYEAGRLVELQPKGKAKVFDTVTGQLAPDDAKSQELVEEATSYYQIASDAFRKGWLKISRADMRKGNPVK
ncbi:MAG: alkaline phosphatase family protein [Burkholderiaceae bacterium]|nr:MAG: alkaline phosphatase family protein [Burkholderiaceae bacterium]